MSVLPKLTRVDHSIVGFDKALRAIVPRSNPSTRALPVSKDTLPNLSISEARHVAGLMRINHTGEVCAQGLYHGQAFTAKNAAIKEAMQHSADEEIDHLVWCEIRLEELSSHPSIFTPIWYAMSFALGAGAGLVSNEFSLGFVAETEAQVSEHLEDHMAQLPTQDIRSREILAQMNIEELSHREAALHHGGSALPRPIKGVMRRLANFMKGVAYHV